jgi:transcriptional regulator with XRE-family HTH domain
VTRYPDPLIVQLRNARLDAGLSQRQLAKLSGVSASTILNAENGRYSPSLASVRPWAKALALTITALPDEPDGE